MLTRLYVRLSEGRAWSRTTRSRRVLALVAFMTYHPAWGNRIGEILSNVGEV